MAMSDMGLKLWNDFKSNQKVGDHSQDMNATITPVDCLARLVIVEASEYTVIYNNCLETIILTEATQLQKKTSHFQWWMPSLNLYVCVFHMKYKHIGSWSEEISKGPGGLKG